MSNIFISNKYTDWYFRIIENAQNRILPESTYTEKHHIIPRSLGGSNDNYNLVSLTAREHYIVHRLLVKMTTGKAKYKMSLALSYLSLMSITHNNGRSYNSRQIEIMRNAKRNIKRPKNSIEKMVVTRKNKPTYKPIVYLGVQYNRIRDAHTITGHNEKTITTRIRSKNYTNCYYGELKNDQGYVGDGRGINIKVTDGNKIYNSSREAARELGVCKNTILNRCKKEIKGWSFVT